MNFLTTCVALPIHYPCRAVYALSSMHKTGYSYCTGNGACSHLHLVDIWAAPVELHQFLCLVSSQAPFHSPNFPLPAPPLQSLTCHIQSTLHKQNPDPAPQILAVSNHQGSTVTIRVEQYKNERCHHKLWSLNSAQLSGCRIV